MNIALVDDSNVDAEKLQEYIARFAQETDTKLHVDRFPSAEDFLSQKEQPFRMVILDIDMPGMNGVECARKLREQDKEVVIMFVTNMPQYALNGYEVEAVDYVLKPVSYPDFSLKLRKALRYVKQNRGKEILLQAGTEQIPVWASEILYVESDRHYLTYHLPDREIRVRDGMTHAEQQLNGMPFARCNVGYLVNLQRVTLVKHDTVMLGDIALPISRGYRKEFSERFMAYIGGVEV